MSIRGWVPGRSVCKSAVPVSKEGSLGLGFPQEINQLFQDFFGSWPFETLPLGGLEGGAGRYVPQVEVTEDERQIRVSAELPGLDQKDVEVSFTDGVLTIRGEKKIEREAKAENYYRTERAYGAFHRAIPLPADVDEEKAQATFAKGILTVTLPKTEEAKRRVRNINVQGE